MRMGGQCYRPFTATASLTDTKFGVKRTNMPVVSHMSMCLDSRSETGFGNSLDHIFGVHDTKPGESRRPMHGTRHGGLCTLLAKALGISPMDGNIVGRLLHPQPLLQASISVSIVSTTLMQNIRTGKCEIFPTPVASFL